MPPVSCISSSQRPAREAGLPGKAPPGGRPRQWPDHGGGPGRQGLVQAAEQRDDQVKAGYGEDPGHGVASIEGRGDVPRTGTPIDYIMVRLWALT
jgi:hypothetical protein